MPEITIPQRACGARELADASRDPAEAFYHCNGLASNATLLPYTPCCLTPDDPQSMAVLQSLRALSVRERAQLAGCAEQFGDLTTPLAEFYHRHLTGMALAQNAVGLTGAGSTAHGAYEDAFRRALAQYQESLVRMHELERARSPTGAQRALLQAQVRQRYQILNQQFRHELRRLVPAEAFGKNRGNALSGADRGITLASRGRARGIYVADQVQAVRLGGFAKSIAHVGNGMLVLDAGLRAYGVRQTYLAGGNWQRQAAMETTGFGVGGAAGLLAGKAAVGGLVALGLAATPAGWVIVIGLGVAAGFGAAYAGNEVGKGVADWIWSRGS